MSPERFVSDSVTPGLTRRVVSVVVAWRMRRERTSSAHSIASRGTSGPSMNRIASFVTTTPGAPMAARSAARSAARAARSASLCAAAAACSAIACTRSASSCAASVACSAIHSARLTAISALSCAWRAICSAMRCARSAWRCAWAMARSAERSRSADLSLSHGSACTALANAAAISIACSPHANRFTRWRTSHPRQLRRAAHELELRPHGAGEVLLEVPVRRILLERAPRVLGRLADDAQVLLDHLHGLGIELVATAVERQLELADLALDL